MLRNPAYAGYYAYGRRQVEPRRKIPGRPDTGRVAKDASEWLVRCRAGCRPTSRGGVRGEPRPDGRQPATAAAPGAPRDGPGAAVRAAALRPVGGHRMPVSYHDAAARSAYGYTCACHQVNYGTGGAASRSPPRLDDHVAAQVLYAVAPAALEVSAAAAQAEDERAELDKLWRQRARARPLRLRPGPPPVPAGRAGEPARRPPARADWEAALAETARLEAEYQRFTEEQPAALTPAERAAIQALAATSRGLGRPDDHAGRPQGAAADPDRGHHRHRQRRQRARRRHHHLGGGTRPAGRPSGPSPAWTSCRITPPSSPGSPGSPPRAAATGRSPMSSTPRDSGRPSGPAGSATSRSAP